MKRILLLAGEESGVLYAREIAARLTDCEIRGYADYGFMTHDLAVMGLFLVLKRLPYFLSVKRTMERAIDTWKPDLVVTIDYPGLNLKLAACAKARGIRTVHVVSPQVWAWKKGRIPKIEAALDRLCCFFPFEPAIYRPGFATFVGHPLVAAFAALGRGKTRPHAGAQTAGETVVALLPGSRAGEISRHLPILLGAAKLIVARVPGVRFVIPAANERAKGQIEAIVGRRARGDTRTTGERVEIRLGGARELLVNEARAAVVASGTATLEASLAECPTVLVYQVGILFEAFMRLALKGVRHIGLANVIWEKMRPGDANFPMPELLQRDFTAEAVADYIVRWLTDGAAHAEAVRRLAAANALLATAPGTDPIGNIIHEL